MEFHPPALYPIIDVGPGDATEPLALADALMRAGAPWIQLRVKSTSGRDHLAIARALVDRARTHAAKVIVNDRLDVAVASGAAGVHVGQDDLPLAAVREFAAARPHLVVGVSTHDVAQAREAERGGADYIGFGPIFPTPTKRDALPPRAEGALAEVRAAVSLPIVAIGGITAATAPGVLARGANSVAMIGALARAPAPAALAASLLALEGYRS